MAKTVMTIKTDPKLKKQAAQIAGQMGFPLGTLINALLRKFVQNKTIYFSLIQAEAMPAFVEKELSAIEEDLKTGKNISPAFEHIDQALAYLKKK